MTETLPKNMAHFTLAPTWMNMPNQIYLPTLASSPLVKREKKAGNVVFVRSHVFFENTAQFFVKILDKFQKRLDSLVR